MRLRFVFAALIPLSLFLTLAVSATRAQQNAKESTPEAIEPTEVALDVQFITMNEATCQKLGMCCPASTDAECTTCCGSSLKACNKDCAAKKGVKFLDREQVAKLLNTVQADSTAKVITLPKVCLYTGKKSQVAVGEEKTYVTGVTIKTKEGQTIFIPEVEKHRLGSKVDLRPVVSGDGRYVKLTVNATMDALESDNVPLLPISVPLSIKLDPDRVAHTETVTQLLQQPKFCTYQINKELVLPDGGTAVLHVCKRTHEVKKETPILSDIPYLNRLFTNVSMETECVVMLVRARIVIEDKQETKTESPLKN
jgi:type II secretory pathway component GspD/PulD (secretin)